MKGMNPSVRVEALPLLKTSSTGGRPPHQHRQNHKRQSQQKRCNLSPWPRLVETVRHSELPGSRRQQKRISLPLLFQRLHQAGQRPLMKGWRIRIMFSYTSAISKKWLAIVFHGPKLGNIRTPFGHFFGHSSASLSAISYEKSIAFLRGASLFY